MEGRGGEPWGGGVALADSMEEVSQPYLTSSSRVCLLAEKPSCHQSSTHNKGQLLSLQATKISIIGKKKMGESETVVNTGWVGVSPLVRPTAELQEKKKYILNWTFIKGSTVYCGNDENY